MNKGLIVAKIMALYLYKTENRPCALLQSRKEQMLPEHILSKVLLVEVLVS